MTILGIPKSCIADLAWMSSNDQGTNETLLADIHLYRSFFLDPEVLHKRISLTIKMV